MFEIVLFRAAQSSRDKHSIFPTDHEAAVNVEHRSKLRPQLVCPLKQRHIHRMLEVHLPNDPAVAMRRCVLMSGQPALQAEHLLSATCEMSRGGAAHRTKSGDYDVEVISFHCHIVKDLQMRSSGPYRCRASQNLLKTTRIRKRKIEAGSS